jgi:hypothetical protein
MPLFTPSTFKFTQAEAATTWNIAHNLGNNCRRVGAGSAPSMGMGIPIVDVFILNNGQLSKVIPASIVMVDANNVTITFGEPQSGFAQIVV